MHQVPRKVPGLWGALRATEMSTVVPAGADGTSTAAGPPICSPLKKASWNPGPQLQVPLLRKRHILRNSAPGARCVLSGMLTSVTKTALRVQPLGWGNAGAGVGGSVGGRGTDRGAKFTVGVGWTVMVIVAGSLA